MPTNFLHEHGVEHDAEPPWPHHERLNDTGRLRGDWRLSDGTLFEFAGMMESADYALRLAAKAELASETGVRLITVTAVDLPHLSRVFAKWIMPLCGGPPCNPAAGCRQTAR